LLVRADDRDGNYVTSLYGKDTGAVLTFFVPNGSNAGEYLKPRETWRSAELDWRCPPWLLIQIAALRASRRRSLRVRLPPLLP
jgi:hypothetical protein